jgi:hypothetical protein
MGTTVRRRELLVVIAAMAALGCNSALDGSDGQEHIGRIEQRIELPPLLAVADTELRSTTPFANYGTSPDLHVSSASIADLRRSLLRFDTAAITSAVGNQALYFARIDLTIKGISAGWLGGQIEIMPMTRGWVEGTGLLGAGPSWVCAHDTNTTLLGNLVNNCSTADNWGMLPTDPYPQPFYNVATDRSRIFTGGIGIVSLDVTRDVQRILNGEPNYGWILAGTGGPLSGEWVNFHARQSTSPPRLILEVGPDQCENDPMKGAPGQCGCGVPDVDANFDGIADCIDAAVHATADTTLRLAIPFGNDGTGALLGVTSASVVGLERALVRVDQDAIDMARNGRKIDTRSSS